MNGEDGKYTPQGVLSAGGQEGIFNMRLDNKRIRCHLFLKIITDYKQPFIKE